ncbi:cation diffusion facilitator family transporter [Bacterioplanoides pacificum]|uniref:Cation diffusion facilitator family transporter n=1 Tax=Bacterioplanoides pacificum TaxID=1171596 RepID=A0ABV7VWK2_9GAMM
MSDVRSSRLVKQAAYASMLVAAVLLLSKLVVWAMSDSTSVLSSMLDSMMDIVASVVNFFAIRYALMPADDDHPFGHSKAEGIAALLQAAFICGSVMMLLLQVADRLLHPQALAALPESIGVMVFSTLLTLLLVLFQRWVYRRTGSLAIKADSAHYASDILTNIAVVGALLGVYFGWLWLDPVIALVVAMVLLKSVYSIVVMALDVLMDKALEPEAEQQIADLIEAQAGVQGFHDLKTRQAGAVQFIQLHLELEASQPLHQAHATGDRVEQAIRAVFPRAEVLIHHDPV